MSATTCPSCNTSVPPGAVFCDNCGYDLRTVDTSVHQPLPPTHHVSQDEGEVNCPNCGYTNIAGSAFCENCGSQLAQKAPPPPAPQAPGAAAVPGTPPAPPQEPPAVSPPKPSPAAAPPPTPAPTPSAAPPAPSPDFVSGYFDVQGVGATLTIPQGKRVIVIGREDPVSGVFPEIDLDQHGGQEAGVGRKHAQLFLQGGQLFIEDLDSVNGTVVNKQKLAPRQPHPVKDNDEIRLGMLVLVYHAG